MADFIDKLAWMYIRDRRTLFARSHGKSLFYTVGGKREPGESDQEALIREVSEETGVQLKEDTIKHFHTFQGESDIPGVEVRLTCYEGVGDREPQASREIEELAWLTSTDGARTTTMGQSILKWLEERDLID